MRQIQGADVKVLADVSSQLVLVNDDKFYSPSKAKSLRNSLLDGDLGSNVPATILTNSTVDSYDMSGVLHNSMVVHKYTSFAYYNLTAPSAAKKLIFSNEQDISTDGTNIIVGPTNNVIYWTSNSTAYTATLTTATYTRATLMTEVKTQMDASADVNVFTCTYDSALQQYKIVAGTNTFKFMFATNTTNSARKVLGQLAVDGTLALTQYSELLESNMRIKLSSGVKVYVGSSILEYPGYIVLKKKGVSCSLIGLDSTTWLLQEIIGEESHKNTSLGIGTDYSLVGRDTWVAKATAGTGRYFPAGFALNGYGYSCDGQDTSTRSNEVVQYNDTANTWATKATGGTARDYLAGFSLNGYGYICYGTAPGYTAETNQYNDGTNIWTTKTSGSTARRGGCSFSLNGYGYYNGGYNGSYVANVDKYNDNLNSWSSMTVIPTARMVWAGFMLNGYGYACNGEALTNEVDQYNDSANAWIVKATAGTSRSETGGFSNNGYGYSCGGDNAGFKNEVNQYNDATNVWATKTNTILSSGGRAAFSLNGFGYLANGSSGTTNACEQYN